jgi:hypothetical protein
MSIKSSAIIAGKLNKRVSVVFYLTDNFTGNVINHARIRLIESPLTGAAINKGDGHYVFINLEPAAYTFLIECESYMTIEQEVSISANIAQIYHLQMQHTTNSKLLEGITCIKMIFKDSKGKLIDAGEKRNVVVVGSSNLIRTVEPLVIGQQQLRLYSNHGYRLEGKQWLLYGEHKENIKTQTYQVREDCYLLEQPLLYEHQSGEPLYPMSTLILDEQGAAILPLANYQVLRQELVEILVMNKQQEMSYKVKIEYGNKVILECEELI